MSAHTSYTVFTADDVNQTFVEWAHTTAQAATVAAVVVPPVVDPETGLAVNATTEEPVEVRAVFEAQVTIEACNTVGLCTPVDAAPASVDLTPPQTVAVSRKLHPSISLFDGVFLADDDFEGEHYTTDTHRWSAAWTGGDDSESGVAFFTVSVIDVDSGVAVAGPRNVGKSKWFAVDNLALEHGHMYITEVTTYVHGAAIGARAVCVYLCLNALCVGGCGCGTVLSQVQQGWPVLRRSFCSDHRRHVASHWRLRPRRVRGRRRRCHARPGR